MNEETKTWADVIELSGITVELTMHNLYGIPLSAKAQKYIDDYKRKQQVAESKQIFIDAASKLPNQSVAELLDNAEKIERWVKG